MRVRTVPNLFRLFAGAPLLVILMIAMAACQEPGAAAAIVSPDNRAHYVVSDSIWFQAEVGSDLHEPLGIEVEGDWIWTSDLDGELGYRALFRRNDLSIGEHLITLRVRNTRGLVLRDQVRIFIDPPRR